MIFGSNRQQSRAFDCIRSIAIGGIRLLSVAITLTASADIDLSGLQYSTSASSDGRRLELREEGTVGHALVSGTEYKGDPNGGAATAWNTASLTTGWQTLTSGTNAAAILKLDSQSTAIEGGRLQSNATWDSSKIHVVRNWVTVPNGVTLTVSQGTIVKFCAAAGIKVLSGGKVQINGADGADVFFAAIGNDTYGGDTNLRAGDFETNSYEIVTLNGGTWSDNGYWVTPDAQLRGYPEVTLHDSLASVSDGVARVPVTVEGTRNAPFSIDWQITGAPFSTTSGTLSWTQSSEGTKYIEIPLKSSYSPSGVETFTVRATLARSVTRVNETAQVKVFKGGLDVASLQYSTSAASAGRRLELRGEGTVGHALVNGTEYKGDPNGGAATAWNTASLTTGWQTLTSGTNAAAILKLDPSTTAIEGGRLQSDTTWSNAKTHVVRNWVTVPSGVTLTISQGAIVKFCEMAGIKVLSGGKVQIDGAEGADVFFASIGNDTYGGDTNLRAGDFETNSYEIVTLNGGTWSDNGYWVTPDAAVRPYPEVALHDAIGAVEGGVVRVPVSVSGIRNAPFSIDWQIAGAPFRSTSGTLTWPQSSEGTKFIEIPIKANYSPNGMESFALSATRARSVNLSNETVRVSVYSGNITVGDVIEKGESTPSAGTEIETRGIGGTMIAKALERITYSPRWSGAASCEVAVDGNRLLSTAIDSGTLAWTRPDTPGLYTFTHKAGGETLTARFAVLGDDTTAIESNRLQSNATWTAEKTWLITGELTIASGVTLTIEPGAVVKFMPGAKLIVEAGGTCIAKGVKFTHAYDDAVGGDTLFDGAATLPVMEDYEIKGTVTDDDSTEYRYTAPIVLSGTITANTMWRGWKVYNVTGNLTIQNGVTLTIEPGAVVKFNSGVSLTVNSGATLNAIGTRAQPIVFTSIKDDEYGGDTNGDGEKTRPTGGDWRYVYVSGTANLKYCKAMYGAPSNETGILETSGSGALNMDCCFVGYALYDGIWNWGGTISVKNTVITDTGWATAPYRGSKNEYINCIFYQNNVGMCYWSNWNGNPVYRNCIFAECGYGWCELNSGSYGDPSSRFTTINCLFWNPVGIGVQSCGIVGSNGNIWGDPMFVDAENGDFRLQKGSPCINAGDAANAPEFDYYGQPRDDGTPDIGIYELAGGMSANDLAAVAVDVQAARSTIADTLTISYDVANTGKQAINGSWRDKVSLVSVDGGYSIDLGTVVQTAALAVGATNTFNASFTVPTDAEGTWRVQVGVNVERDIYEGANITNNVATSEGTVEVSLPTRAASDGFSGTATKGAPASAKFALDGAEPMVARINAPAGTVVYFGSGFMPSASSYSARAVVGADGGLIGIPAGVTSAYILVETTSSKGVSFTMTLESAALAVQSVTPATLPYTGTTGLVIDGANFVEGCTVVAWPDGQPTAEVALGAANVVSATRLSIAIDCNGLQSGTSYTLCVVDADGNRATLPNAVKVANVPAAPKLKATLDAPVSVRRGRTLTVYIDYENVGNADLPAPIFELISDGQVFKIDGACYTNSVKVMGLSSEAPVGTLRPGEPQRIGIPVTILAENVKWKLKSYHAAQASAKTKRLSLRELYDEDWVLYHVSDDDTTIANLRTAIGSTFADYYTNLGAWLGSIEPQTPDYETLKSAFGRYLYLKAAGMLDAENEDSNTGGLPVQNMNASAARSTGVAAGATLLGVGEPTRGCNHALTEDSWMRYPRDGSIWKMCPVCKKWALAVREISQMSAPGVTVVPKYEVLEPLESNKNTYIICHGNQNSVATDWVGQMGQAIIGVADVNVLAINWGVGADHDLPHVSAANIAGTVSEARRELEALEYNPSKTTLIGHSHGGHVAARLITETLFGTFERFVGLDVSTTDNWVHGIAGSVKTWIREIKGRCRDEQVEFYKSSWNMSLEDRDQLYGKYNFAIVDEGDFYEAPSLKGLGANPIELNRHSLSHVWFRATILNIGGAFNDLGFNFKGDSSWKRLCRNNGENDIGNPAGEALAGVIRGSVIEMLSVPRTGEKHDDWRYSDVISPGKKMHSMGSLAGFGNQSETMLSLYVNSFRAIDYSIGGVSISEKLSGGTTISATINNEADNLSIDYTKKDGEGFSQFLPWRNGTEGLATGAWLIDLEGLSERDGSLEDKNWEAESYLTLKNAIGANEAKYVRRIAMRVISSPNISKEGDMPFVLPQRSSLCALTVDAIDNELFGKDKLLTERQEDGTIKYRKVLLLVATGISANPNATSFADIFRSDAKKLPVIYDGDLYVSNNFKILNVEVDAQGVFAVISKAAVTKKSASLRSPRLFAAPPTHELSESALKPGEVVNVYANSNGVWSISLNCTESYTTAEDDELVFNRFELTDAGGEDGAPRFQNNNTICDVDSVIISGTLPTATDADGNRVCEGKLYTVQLTVSSSENEDDVTTCILDVRYDPEHDDGEDEDEDDSSEPKSCDPNEMVGEEGVGEARYVKPGQELTYTIYFENKSDADAAAACVEVVNPLNEWLDWSSLTMLDVGYNNNVDNGLGGLHEGVSERTMDGTNTSVRTEFVIEPPTIAADSNRQQSNAIATWYLRIIDPNGDSEGWPLDMTGGFLPPNNEETHCGEGYIRYKVKVRDDAPGNVVITNSATIIFDHFNDPIETDPAWWNTVGAPGAAFAESEVEAGEGETATVRVMGGSAESACSVKVYLTYNTAAAADIDLKASTVIDSNRQQSNANDSGIEATNLKFPLTLNWAKGEIGEKVISIPIKADKTVEDDEFFTLQLAEAVGMELGEERACTVTIRDLNDKTLKTTVTPYKPKKNEPVSTNSVTVAAGNAKGGFVSGTGEYTSGSKLTLTAEPRPGWAFAGWKLNGGDGSILSDKAKWQVVVTNDEEYVAVFSKIPYVRGLANPADGGKVSGSGYCAPGKKVTLKASASKNYTFLGWAMGPVAIDGNREQSNAIEYIATTPTLVIDRTAKPAANSKTSTTITDIGGDVTYYAVFKSDPKVTVTVEATDGAGAALTGKGAGKYVAGIITGEGKYAPGKKVMLKATANKGYVFAGWDSQSIAIDSNRQQSSIAFTMPSDDVEYVAKFVTADEDKGSIELGVNGADLSGALTGTPALSTNIWAGVYLEWPVAASALSEPKVKVAGLPTGLKFTDKPLTAKIGSGKTAVVVTNVPANTIYGAPTAASKIDRNGSVTPSKVVFTVTTAGKSTQTYQIDTFVDALPLWAQGTFSGGGIDCGQVSLTVSAAGKTSGKALGEGLTYTLAAPYYTGFELMEGVSNFLADVTASWSYKDGTKAIKTNDVVQLVVQDNGIGGYAAVDDWFEAYTVNWKVEPWKTLGKKIDKTTMAYAILPGGSFSDTEDVLTSALGADVTARVTLKFAAGGAVAIAGEFVTGFDESKQKYTTVKATGSATLVPSDAGHGEVFIYLAPKGLPIHARCVEVRLPAD